MISQLTPYLGRVVITSARKSLRSSDPGRRHTYSVPVVRESPRPTERDELARTW